MPRSNSGAHAAAVIDDTVHERMALYDDLPRKLRDIMKEQSFNYSPVSMREWAEQRGVEAVAQHMLAFDRKHWRQFFREEIGEVYPCSPK